MPWPSSNTSAYQPFDQNGNSQPIAPTCEPGPGDYPQFSQNHMSYNDNYNLTYSTQYSSPGRPRYYNDNDLASLPAGIVTVPSYPPEAYQIDPSTRLDNIDISDQESNGHLTHMSNDYNQNPYNSQVKVEDPTGYQSPYSSMTRESTPHDSMSPYPTNSEPEAEVSVDKEQPYAQLIYQALLHADGHTMILRDIYDWFKKHTDKATASETKGWQNSIRHNLSMNGAFEKVDQPGEESRKGFMWRLSADAIREGVKSTTRYRSKVPNKRGYRSHHPHPQRQASGSKGGHAARRSVRMRRSNRMQDSSSGGYTSDPYGSRRVPDAFDGPGGAGDLYSSSPGYASHDDMDFYPKDPSTDLTGHDTAGAHFDLFAPSHNHGHGHSHSHNIARPYTYTSAPLPPQGHPHGLQHGLQHNLPHGLPHGIPSVHGLSDQPAFLFEHGPAEGLFADTPSPTSMDEPCTPGSADGGGGGIWTDNLGLVGWEEGGYREYIG